ncbi:MAG: hypothetical protein GHCLOJNM_00581 [bacterium]|nr:hypothetical protein [bacterium]
MLKALLSALVLLAAPASGGPLLQFERLRIGDRTYEAASACDINRDGTLDIVSGAYWFPGPDYSRSIKMAEVERQGDYFDDFSNYPLDVNGDGWVDIITGGWWGKTVRWRENPKGKAGLWATHDIDETGNVETIRFWDVDGDGVVEICPNAGGNVSFYKRIPSGGDKEGVTFRKTLVKQGGCGHGLGFGDINGDGRGDFVIPEGWLEAPEKPLEEPWPWHPEFDLGVVSVPVLVQDVNEDGKADLIAGYGHSYGLCWWEQGADAEGKRTWTRHDIDPDRSQYHDMALADIDNDGKPELITGKRWRAHPAGDPGLNDPVGVYYYNIDGGAFERITLDYGSPERASGVGIYLWVEDLDGNGWKDILAPGKEGLYLFKNKGEL